MHVRYRGLVSVAFNHKTPSICTGYDTPARLGSSQARGGDPQLLSSLVGGWLLTTGACLFVSVLAEEFTDIFNALHFLLLVGHHSEGGGTITGQQNHIANPAGAKETHMNFFLSWILSILCSTLSFTMNR